MVVIIQGSDVHIEMHEFGALLNNDAYIHVRMLYVM